MDFQIIIVIAIIAAALVYAGLSFRKQSRSNCGNNCGCGTEKISPD